MADNTETTTGQIAKETIPELLEMVQKDGTMLKYIDPYYRTKEMSIEAVKQNPDALWFVRKDILNYDICLEDGMALNIIPDKHKTYNLCLEAVKQNGAAYYYVPDKHKTEKLRMETVKQNGSMIKYMAKGYTPEDLILVAVATDGMALEYIHPVYKTQEVCTRAFYQNNACIGLIPDALRDNIVANRNVVKFDDEEENEDE